MGDGWHLSEPAPGHLVSWRSTEDHARGTLPSHIRREMADADQYESPSVHDHAFWHGFCSTAVSRARNVRSLLVTLRTPLGGPVKSAPHSADSSRGTDVETANTDVFASSDSPPGEVKFPISLPDAALVTAQSDNYGLNTTFDTQWSNLTPKQTLGFVFHPRTKKFYSVAFYHQIHCLNALRKYVARG